MRKEIMKRSSIVNFEISMFNKKQKGFTLIELLVVIAIIGLLAGIVLVSLGGARDSARNARIQASISQFRSAAELFANDATGNAYTGICADASVSGLRADLSAQSGAASVCFDAATDYCISSGLVGGANICVSDAGVVGSIVCAAATTACL